MINKQNLWFATLFSLILILSIYYLTMKDDTLNVISSKNDDNAIVELTENDSLVALRVAEDENILAQIEEYQNILLDTNATLEEKNDAYENLQTLNTKKGEVESIERLINEKFSLKSFVKLDKDQINIVIASTNHNTELANSIIREVQSLYEMQKYITIKFQ